MEKKEEDKVHSFVKARNHSRNEGEIGYWEESNTFNDQIYSNKVFKYHYSMINIQELSISIVCISGDELKFYTSTAGAILQCECGLYNIVWTILIIQIHLRRYWKLYTSTAGAILLCECGL